MKYTVGIDFGTLSARALLVDTATGREVAAAEWSYPHGVMASALPDGTRLGPGWALQHPGDYLKALEATVPGVLAQAGVDAGDVVGIGVDFTSASPLPVDAEGVPLCFREEFAREPHAWVKLWKHHAAQDQADRMTATAGEWLEAYGGKVSCEWSLPKLWQVLEEAPRVYDAMAYWMEAGDWVVWQLCGRPTQSACAAGFKSFYRKGVGFPEADFFGALDPRLRDAVREKLSAPVIPAFSRAGGLTETMAARLGLRSGTPVAAFMIDAHACVPAAGMTQPGQMLAIIGTSACYMALGESGKPMPGICGAVEDGILPGLWAYEAGQSAVGDLLAWTAEYTVPEAYRQAARERGLSVQQYLTELAQIQKPGAHGLVALDWWNGNRSILMDSQLSGLLMGMTLSTRPEDIYRALVEATAFGARTITENYRAGGIEARELLVTGGICHKNPMMMQIYADVLQMPVRILASRQGGALGSAILGAVAAGKALGGYDTPEAAMEAMASPWETSYLPDPANSAVYDKLYGIYRSLHDSNVRELMHALSRLRLGTAESSETR